MPHSISPLRVVPLDSAIRKDSQLGAEVLLPESDKLLSPTTLSEQDRVTLRQGLFDHGVLIVRNQQGLDPRVLYDIAQLIDPQAGDIHSGGEKAVVDPKNILSKNNAARIPRAPQVVLIGQGRIEGHEGVPQLDLKHVDQSSFHEEPLSEDEVALGYTRPYRWHMDAPLYENLPGIVTSLLGVEVPDLPEQKLQFHHGQSMDIAAGATLFFSGARNFELLTPEEQEFALNTTVQYAPRAYEWMADCKASADGLTIPNTGREKQLHELPPWTWDKVQAFPMVWKNLGNGQPHLQILGCCVYSLTTTDPKTGEKTIIDEVQEVRRICHNLQRKVYTPTNVLAHAWEEGDLVMFHNRGVMHSISGQLAHHPARRLLWQCNMASGVPAEPYRPRSPGK